MRVVIVGGGISGLAAAEAILEGAPRGVPPEVQVFEASARAGGAIRSERVEGNVVEHGPNGFLDREPATLALCARLGLEAIEADESAARRFLYRAGRLRLLPRGLPGLLFGGALPFIPALRALREPNVKTRSPAGESVHDFAARRFGSRVAELLVQAMVTGIHGGDARALEVAAAFPKLVELERVHGSVIRGLKAEARVRRASAASKRASPGGVLRSFAHGMEELVHALVKRVGPRLVLENAVRAITPLADGWRVATRRGVFEAERLVLATPADETARLLAPLEPEVAGMLAQVPYAPLAVVVFGYFEAPGLRERTRGFGFLAPPGQGVRILGSIWSQSIFPQHGAPGWITTRTMIGGALDPTGAALADEELVRLAHADQARVFKIEPAPRFVRVFRWPRAIPQYVAGHSKRLAAIDALHARYPTLSLIGNAWRGVGVNDCVREAAAIARDRMQPS